MNTKSFMLVPVVALILVACGGGGGEAEETPGEAPPCTATGTELSVSAMNIQFSTDCLAAPAGQAFTITFENNDAGTMHNVAIYTDESAQTPLFQGEIFEGVDSMTYEVPALDAGTFFFRCDVHPTIMTGTFVVEG